MDQFPTNLMNPQLMLQQLIVNQNLQQQLLSDFL
jgi:hypothetical protein